MLSLFLPSFNTCASIVKYKFYYYSFGASLKEYVPLTL